jgi:hypothetical protein
MTAQGGAGNGESAGEAGFGRGDLSDKPVLVQVASIYFYLMSCQDLNNAALPHSREPRADLRTRRDQDAFNPRKSGFSGLQVHRATDGIEKIEVECKKLDDIARKDRRIGFLKVDVERGEYGIFRGTRRIFAESLPIVPFECANSALAKFGSSASQV